MKNTAIGWCHHTVNPWWGCAKVSAACAHCYAETLAKRYRPKQATWGPGGLRWTRAVEAIEELRLLNGSARRRGVFERVFINSMSDTFEDRLDLIEPRRQMLDYAEGLTNLQLLLLTKRPENIRSMVPGHWLRFGAWPAHVGVGATVENQEMGNRRVTNLLDVPAAMRFLSCEPLLGPFDPTLDGLWNTDCPHCADGEYYEPDTNASFCPHCEGTWKSDEVGIHWIIVGGESGGHARPMHPDWARELRDACAVNGVPFFYKQWGEYLPHELTLNMDRVGKCVYVAARTGHPETNHLMARVGTKRAGHVLDGCAHNAIPAAWMRGAVMAGKE